jgi:hypothetical protein
MNKSNLTKALDIGIIVCVFLLGYFMINAAGTLFHLDQVSVLTSTQEMNVYKVRSGLLMEAMGDVGVCKPEDAARVWAEGLKTRSAARQYAVMASDLKTEYARQLEKTFPNWVTGVSSPWVESYEITAPTKTDEDNYSFVIQFSTATSTGPAGQYNASLVVTRQGDFWRITKIDADKELSVYTGFVS